MPAVREESHDIHSDEDVVQIRQMTRRWAVDLGFTLVDQTKIVTAASELARNTLDYGGGGSVDMELVDGAYRGVRLTFTDEGPGIGNIDEALRDGFSTGDGLGLGLGGARRLSSEFAIRSEPGKGTRVTIARWK